MTDIPQDQVEAVWRAICVSNAVPLCKNVCPDCRNASIAAIRVLTPLIAAVERERCAEIADSYATAARAYAPESTEEAHVIAARSIAFDIRSVKGAVT